MRVQRRDLYRAHFVAVARLARFLGVAVPRLLPADEACVAENVVAAVERCVRMHAFVRRAP